MVNAEETLDMGTLQTIFNDIIPITNELQNDEGDELKVVETYDDVFHIKTMEDPIPNEIEGVEDYDYVYSINKDSAMDIKNCIRTGGI